MMTGHPAEAILLDPAANVCPWTWNGDGARHILMSMADPSVTQVLSQIRKGDAGAAERLLPLVYDELRRLAAARLAGELPGQTLQATALVHEAYLRLVSSDEQVVWDGQGHFFAAAAEAMRRILIEKARHKRRLRHGGGRKRLSLESLDVADDQAFDELLALDEALARLAVEEPVVADVVKLRYFAGLTADQTAKALRISLRTAHRHWAYAKAWLFQELRRDDSR
jgi:RNA polymerase sigma factor (TIGR02999 family)